MMGQNHCDPLAYEDLPMLSDLCTHSSFYIFKVSTIFKKGSLNEKKVTRIHIGSWRSKVSLATDWAGIHRPCIQPK